MPVRRRSIILYASILSIIVVLAVLIPIWVHEYQQRQMEVPKATVVSDEDWKKFCESSLMITSFSESTKLSRLLLKIKLFY